MSTERITVLISKSFVRMVIQGGSFKGYGKQSDHLKPKEVVSLLLDDEEIERKYKAKADNAGAAGSSVESAAIAGYNEDSSDAGGGGVASSSENMDSGSQTSSRDREDEFYGLTTVAI